ncbi:hypothetical protein K493DRAFT_373483 [Basidiobolus meristosporus CBS 931.73]|uniref:SEC63 domain-containing protein n=1 Tax=Basidiobolus meristosporus CBS 931.73 TaxID=1314790 RepID=A0A1Y1Z6S6_9FUNG|nr:hypothetical protein K493DRAFT_373483 [Basidiobolus meristosporus CBS 931.73]|eukprot:ORY05951.1 hypothetical protein K493DRAFT_373483 [Basidiobolus meristosporus CBS 931.73]
MLVMSYAGYNNSKYQEYSELDILQMIGRAGRPQFDSTGAVVIMTSSEKKEKYEQLISGKETIESRLKSTFLYVRIKSNPAYYMADAKHKAQQNSEKALEDHSDRTNRSLMKLEILSKAEEFSELRIQSGEKSALNKENKNASLKYPLKGKIKTVDERIFLIIQFMLEGITFSEPKIQSAVNQDTNIIILHGSRILKCVIECCLEKKDPVALKNAISLYRCLKAKCWENSPGVLKQIEKIGPQSVRQLCNARISSLEKLGETDPHRIEMVASIV